MITYLELRMLTLANATALHCLQAVDAVNGDAQGLSQKFFHTLRRYFSY
jgi:hypothetical protein